MSVQVKKFRAALKHGSFSATAILPGEDPTAFKELHQNRGAAERQVRPMGEYKPFTYSATQWVAIRMELPSLPATSSGQLWSTVGARRIPLIVGGGEVRPRDPKWARTMLERTAREFLAFEAASCRRHDAAAAERRACKEASRALRRSAGLLEGIPDMAAEAGIIAKVAAAAQTRATPSRGGRRPDVNRDWLFEQLLLIREQCGGATRTSTHGGRDARRGGPLVRFLMAACGPLFKACKREAPKPDAMRGAVRKLLKERKPQPR